MWTLQSTSAPKGPPRGRHIFSLFKMERANPSPAVCDRRKRKHRVFVHESLLPERIALFTGTCVGRGGARARTRTSVCAICTCQMRGDDKQGRVMLFQQANGMTGTSTACTLLINPSVHTAVREEIETGGEKKTLERLENVHFRCNKWARPDSFPGRDNRQRGEWRDGGDIAAPPSAEIDGDTGHNGSAGLCTFSKRR